MTTLRDAVRDNLETFTAYGLKKLTNNTLEDAKYSRLLCDELMRVDRGETKRLLVALPPRHLKTLSISTCFPAWVLGRSPSTKILVLSYDTKSAERIAFDVRRLMKSSGYRKIFGTKISKSQVSDFQTTEGGGVIARSIYGGVTGIGADIIIVDDPMEITDCDNTDLMDDLHNNFKSQIQSRLNNAKRGRIIVVGHRLHEDDLIGRLSREDGWRLVSLPFRAIGDRSYKLEDGTVWRRKHGSLLRPDAFSEKEIREAKSAGRPGYDTLYQQNPAGTKLKPVVTRDFLRFDRSRLRIDQQAVVLSIDPGQSDGPHSSCSVVQAWTIVGGKFALIDQWRGQTYYKELRSVTQHMIAGYRPVVVLVEKSGYGHALWADIRVSASTQIIPIIPTEGKIERARKQFTLIRKGLVQLPLRAVWVPDFLVEVTHFPMSPYNDQVDAMVQALEYLRKNSALTPPPPRVNAVVACASSGDFSTGIGVSRTTGYLSFDNAPGAALATFVPTRRRY